MLTPAQVVFDLLTHKPSAVPLTRHEIKIRLSSFPKSHIDGAITQLLNRRKLIRAGKGYMLVPGATRPPALERSIDYHDAESRGYLHAPFSRGAKLAAIA